MLDDDTSSLLLDILVNSSANPHVVRPVVLLLTEIANTYQAQAQTATAPAAVTEQAGGGAGEENGMFVSGNVVSGHGTGTNVVKLDRPTDPRWVTRSWRS